MMASYEPDPERLSAQDIKEVPIDFEQRAAIRRLADELGPSLDRSHPLTREDMERLAHSLLANPAVPGAVHSYLGFAMVALSNVFWRRQFESIPFRRRLLLLPSCLRKKPTCKGRFDHVGLQCAGCGACAIGRLKGRADELGYEVIVAEGTPSVIMKIMEGAADGILGVACLDSLERAFKHVVELGIPHMAVPLLRNGCADTEVEADLVMSLLPARRRNTSEQTHTYVPLLREAVRIFEQDAVWEIIGPCMQRDREAPHGPMNATASIAHEWLMAGGKRLRPFVTIAAYAVARHGTAVLSRDADVGDLIPSFVRKIGLAVEALHKASLVHDDIEDDDGFRYGQQTLHRRYGIGPAINVGDYLVGLGYRLISDEAAELGAQRVADILRNLSSAHVELCRGQGAELLWKDPGRELRPIDALAIYALKTAPAFETALYAGLRAAETEIDPPALRRFCTCLGEGYQILNDLADWREDDRNKVTLGQDVLARRPTLLRAFAIEAGGEEKLAQLIEKKRSNADVVAAVKALYCELGVFAKTERLLGKLRKRANDTAAEIADPALTDLLQFLVRIVL